MATFIHFVKRIYHGTFYIYLIIWLAFLASGVTGWYFFAKLKLEEKKLMIQQGINPEEQPKDRRGWRFPWLKLGIIVMAIGLGFLIIALMINFDIEGQSAIVFPAILCLCTGLGFVVAHFVPRQSKGNL